MITTSQFHVYSCSSNQLNSFHVSFLSKDELWSTLTIWVFIAAELVKHCSANEEAIGSTQNTVEALKLFSG